MTMASLLGRLATIAALSAALAPAVHAAPVPVSPPPVLDTGFRVDWVQVTTSPHSIADAVNALDGGGGFTVIDRVTQYSEYISLTDASVPFAGVDPLFAIRVSGYITLGAGTYSFLSFHDDGIQISVGGETVVSYDADTANIGTDSAFYTLDAGVYAYEAISWEQGGAFNMQLGIDTGAGRFYLAGSHEVPEPSALILVTLALAGLGLQRRGRVAA